jgi:hypothetical protein
MLFLSHGRYYADPGMPTKQEVGGGCHWNLWQVRMPPFKELGDGMHVVLVDSWPGGGRLTWEIETRRVVVAPYSSKAAVVRMISKAVGLPEREVSTHPYTRSHPASGYVLAFGYRPIRRIARPRPKDLRLRQHGWLQVDDVAVLRRWGLSVGKAR